MILLHAEAKQLHRRTCGGEFADQRGEVPGILEGGNVFQRGLNRLQAVLVDQTGIHAGGKVVAVLFLRRGLGVFRGGVQVLPEQVSIALLEKREGPRPAHLVAGDGIVPDPVAAGVLVEIGARVDRFIDRRQVEALDGGRRGRLLILSLRSRGRLRHNRSGNKQQEKCKAIQFHRGSLILVGAPELAEPHLQNGGSCDPE